MSTERMGAIANVGGQFLVIIVRQDDVRQCEVKSVSKQCYLTSIFEVQGTRARSGDVRCLSSAESSPTEVALAFTTGVCPSFRKNNIKM